MKKHFLTGLVILLPIVITLLIMVFVFDLFTTPFKGLIEDFLILSFGRNSDVLTEHHDVLVFLSRILALLTIICLITLLGYFGKRYFMKMLLNFMHFILKKIPFVKSIYLITKDIVKNLLAQDNKPFKHTAVVEFPEKNVYALGFVTGDAPPEMQKGQKLKSVFVPTSPHPISGYVVMYAEDEISPVDIKTEDVFKFLVSCGIYEPEKANQPKPDEN